MWSDSLKITYTLVDYFLHGENRKWRTGFLEYVAWCFEGRASASHLKKKIETDDDVLEKGWKAHTAEIAAHLEKGAVSWAR